MNKELQTVLAHLGEMWRRRWIGLAVAWVTAVIAALVVSRVPERHEIVASVYVDTQTMIKPLLQGLTVQPDIDQMVGMMARTLISRPTIEGLVDSAHLLEPDAPAVVRAAMVDDLMRNIRMSGGPGKNLYEITYRDTDAERGRRVVEELVKTFVASGLEGKRRDTSEAREFVDEQIAIYEKKLEEAENRLKEFKLRNMNLVGALGTGVSGGQDYFARMAQLQQDLTATRVELRAAEQSRDAMRRELAGEDQLLVSTIDDAGPTTELPIDARILAQRKILDDLLRRDTDEHPDVVATRRVIAQLERERQAELEAQRKLPSTARTESKGNPVFQQLKIKLADADATVASLSGRADELDSRLQQLRGAASQMPEAEAELAKLNRDYDVIKRNYEQLAQRRESASISGDVDAGARLADFRVVEPPHINPTPVFPSRMMLVVMALLGSLGAGVAACYGVTQLMPTVLDVRSLRALCPRPVLGTISALSTGAAIHERHLQVVRFAAALVPLVIAYAVWMLRVLPRLA
jgi:polysaccharide chain length determinant protein (PEP-CTERM system associated)